MSSKTFLQMKKVKVPPPRWLKFGPWQIWVSNVCAKSLIYVCFCEGALHVLLGRFMLEVFRRHAKLQKSAESYTPLRSKHFHWVFLTNSEALDITFRFLLYPRRFCLFACDSKELQLRWIKILSNFEDFMPELSNFSPYINVETS